MLKTRFYKYGYKLRGIIKSYFVLQLPDALLVLPLLVLQVLLVLASEAVGFQTVAPLQVVHVLLVFLNPVLHGALLKSTYLLQFVVVVNLVLLLPSLVQVVLVVPLRY